MTDDDLRFERGNLKLQLSFCEHQLVLANREIEYLKRRYYMGNASTGECEHVHQRNFVNWFHITYPNVLIYAIPNEYVFQGITYEFFTKEGGKAGMPDLHVPEFSLWIEMKRDSQSSPSLVQKCIHERLIRIGHAVIIGYGFEDAKEKILTQFPPYLYYVKQNQDKTLTLNKLSMGGHLESIDTMSLKSTVLVDNCTYELESIAVESGGYITLKLVVELVNKYPARYEHLHKYIQSRGSPTFAISNMIRRGNKFQRVNMGHYKLIPLNDSMSLPLLECEVIS